MQYMQSDLRGKLAFRPSRAEDLDDMERIAQEGKDLLHSRGISQWMGSYPCRADFEEDIALGRGRVVTSEGRVAAVCALTLGEEPSYRRLLTGEWRTSEGTYACVHRVAVSADFRGQGVAGFLFEQAARWARSQGAVSLRSDTHPENIAMQHALKKAGFVLCGTLTLLDGDEAGDPRLGYELSFKNADG